MSNNKKCGVMDHPNVQVGSWGCCQCSTYNGEQRAVCKNCNHDRCDDVKLENLSDEAIKATLDSLIAKGLLRTFMKNGEQMYETTDLGKEVTKKINNNKLN